MKLPLLMLCALTPALHADHCADCVYDARKTSLCADHTAAEEAVLEEAEERVEDEKARRREKAYRDVAELTRAHDNAPSPRVARFLAEGLADPDFELRMTVCNLLLDGQHPEEVLKALLGGLKAADKEWKWIDGELKRMNENRGTYRKGGGIQKEEMDRITWHGRWFDAIVTALGEMPDKRSLDALTKIMKRKLTSVPGHQFSSTGRALVKLDDAKGIGTVISFLVAAEKKIRAGKVPTRYPRHGPATLLDVMQAPYRNVKSDDYEAVAEALQAAAEAKGRAPTPGTVMGEAKEWKSWLKKNAEAFDAELGKLTIPVRAKLPEEEKKEEAKSES